MIRKDYASSLYEVVFDTFNQSYNSSCTIVQVDLLGRVNPKKLVDIPVALNIFYKKPLPACFFWLPQITIMFNLGMELIILLD